MRAIPVLAGLCAVALLAACGGRQASEASRPQVVVDPPAAAIPEGWTARRTIWALERVSSDRTSIWVRTVEGGCASFHHTEVREVEAGLRVDVFLLVPARKNAICTAELNVARHRIELPRPLGEGELIGECVPSEVEPLHSGGHCEFLHDEIAAVQKGIP
jgi:hypothetical protein